MTDNYAVDMPLVLGFITVLLAFKQADYMYEILHTRRDSHSFDRGRWVLFGSVAWLVLLAVFLTLSFQGSTIIALFVTAAEFILVWLTKRRLQVVLVRLSNPGSSSPSS